MDTLQSIQSTIKTLQQKGLKATQRNVAEQSKLSIRTIKRYWNRVTPIKQNRVTLPASKESSFTSFKQRARVTPKEYFKVSVYEF